jgi:hypothetical protein
MQSIRSYRELARRAWWALEAAANDQDHCLVAAKSVPLYAAVRLNRNEWEVTGRWPMRVGVCARAQRRRCRRAPRGRAGEGGEVTPYVAVSDYRLATRAGASIITTETVEMDDFRLRRMTSG